MTQTTTIPRVSTKISKKEKALWASIFSDYGSKKACYEVTQVNVANIRNIVNKGRGLVENVEKIRAYVLKLQLDRKMAEQALRTAILEAEKITIDFPTIAA